VSESNLAGVSTSVWMVNVLLDRLDTAPNSRIVRHF
jgi:hypothetical protein